VSALDPDRFHQSVCTVVAGSGALPRNTICLERAPHEAAFLVPQLTRIFARGRPDIVHSRNWATIEAVLAARLARIPGIVHSEHGRDLQTMGRQLRRRRLLRRFSYSCADRVFCVSEELRDYYCRELGLGPTSFEVIPNGVDVEHFRPNAQARADGRAKVGVRTGTLVVGTVGRLDPVKDHSTLLRATEMALENGLDLRLVIVGDGPQRAAIETELASKADLRRHTLLTGDVQNVADWLNVFDIFVLPSLSEGMSNTLLEAMAVGVAPIATAVGGNCEVLEHGHSGMLVQPGNAKDICDLLIQLAAASERRCELGRQARERVIARFSVERMLKRYEEMYCELKKPRSERLAAERVRRDSYVRHLRDS
jgi:sugar transferase (PEP-CTERM/EpsH1 system associated)